jgi:hypothetical protein
MVEAAGIDPDLLMQFMVSSLGVTCDTTELLLKGKPTAGQDITVSNAITVTGCAAADKPPATPLCKDSGQNFNNYPHPAS